MTCKRIVIRFKGAIIVFPKQPDRPPHNKFFCVSFKEDCKIERNEKTDDLNERIEKFKGFEEEEDEEEEERFLKEGEKGRGEEEGEEEEEE